MPTQWLQDKLLAGEPIEDDDIKRLIKDFTGSTQAKQETDVLDFKETFVDSAEGKCKLTKSLVEFSNSSGGILLYGIGDSGARVGCEETLLDRLDPAKIQDTVEKYVDAKGLRIYTRGVQWYKFYVAVIVHPTSVPIVFEKDGEYYVTHPNGDRERRVAFYEGTIAVREGAKGIRAKQRHINELIQRASAEHTEKLVRRFEKVAQLPDDAEIIAMSRGSSQGVKLVSDQAGIPVQIVEDAEGIALPVREVLTGEPFKRLDSEIMSQVRTYKTDNLHRVEAQVITRWYLLRTDSEKLEEAAELAYLSAIRNYAFPMFWAAKMDKERLKKIVEQIIVQPHWPDISEIPYTVLAFFWDERIQYLNRLMEMERYTSVKRTTQKLRELGRDDFCYHARTPVRTVKIPELEEGKGIDLMELYGDRDRSRKVFAKLLSLFLQDELDGNIKPVAKQLDIVLYADKPNDPK